ncbi:MAG: FKBP-type peptidyl-prolyl cis-trans isomerase [Bacteroidaceae bacterium]|nr:FKBP-type peptidyl-prolyl cis-trans isomerase [Bacteroidaceae bacterium]
MAKSNYKEQNIEFLRKKAIEAGVQKTAQGVLYEILQSGNGPKATIRNIVSVYYKGMLIDGSVFDDNTTQGFPDAFRLADLIVGWQIALTQMCVGDKWRIYVPATVGYGAMSLSGIPKHSTLIFEIELTGIS